MSTEKKPEKKKKISFMMNSRMLDNCASSDIKVVIGNMSAKKETATKIRLLNLVYMTGLMTMEIVLSISQLPKTWW